MTVSEIEISRQIVAATRRADALGLVMNAQGNFSVRIPGSDCFIITPHGVPYAGVHKSGLGGGVLSVETLFDYWRSLSVVRPL